MATSAMSGRTGERESPQRMFGGAMTFALLGAGAVGIFFVSDSVAVRNAIYTGLPILTTIAMLFGLTRYRPKPLMPWVLLASGCLFFIIGNAIYLYYEVVRHRAPSFPSIADPFFLSFDFVIAIALGSMIRLRSSGDRGLLIDSLIAGTGLGLLTWALLVQPYFELPGRGILGDALAIGYPVAYILAAVVLTRSLITPGPTPRPLRLLQLSLALFVAGFFGYSMLSLSGDYFTGHAIDAPILLGVIGIGLAALDPRMSDVMVVRERQRVGLTPATPFVYLGSILMGPIALTIRPEDASTTEHWILIGGTAVVALLVVARFGGLVREVEESAAARARASEALDATEREYQSLVEGLPCVVYRAEAGAVGHWDFVSPQIEDLTGYRPHEFLERPGLWLDLIDPRDRAGVVAAEAENLDRGTEVAVQYRVCRRDGDVRWVRERALWTGTGRNRLMQGVILDITERVRQERNREALEARLRQSERLETVGRLAGGIAHDFNNTIAVIRSYGDFLVEALEPGDPRRDDAQEVLRAAAQAAGLTKQLLMFARAEEPVLEALYVNTVIHDLESMFARTIREDVTMKIELREDVPPVEADRVQLEQVLSNLVVNARDAMPDGGELLIRSSVKNVDAHRSATLGIAPGRYAGVTVSDTGTGIAPEVRDHIFEPFFTTKDRAEGTGLGLATAYGIVTSLGGMMVATSEVGAGTTFEIFLPTTERTPKDRLSDRTDGGETVPSLGILLVEDQPSVRAVLQRMLVRQGHSITAVGHPAEAADLVAQGTERFDLLVTDVVMPGMTGPELAGRIGLPTVFMSGYAEGMLDTDQPLNIRNTFVAKPFTAEDVATAISSLFQNRDP